jgi:serine phosphatase RsbU (regulator of sigma subunit)
MFKFQIIIIFLFFLKSIYFGQNNIETERIYNEINKQKNDTTKVNALINLSLSLNNNDFNNSVKCAKQAIQLAQTLKYNKGIYTSYSALADAYWFHTDYINAQTFYFKSYKFCDSINDKSGIALALYNIGWTLCVQQNSVKDSKYLYKSYQIYKDLNDTIGILRVYNALGSYFQKRYHINQSQNLFDSSFIYYSKGLEIASIKNIKKQIAVYSVNLGDLHIQKKEYLKAYNFTVICKDIYLSIGDSSSYMQCEINLATCYLGLKRVKEAEAGYNLSAKYFKNHDFKDMYAKANYGLAKCYYEEKKYKKAYDYFNDFLQLQEKIDLETYDANLANLQGSYNLEKSEANVEKLKQTNEIQQLKNKKNIYLIFALLAIAVIVVTVAGLLYRQNKQKQLTNIQLKEQNTIIAEKKQEIDNSIQYARGIQQAVLPSFEDLKNNFDQSFIYYKPKDVVSGDFYWFAKSENDFYCIVSDCTGHGVPGAFMSIIGMDKIVQAVFEKKITEPGEILSYLNIEIKRVLKQHSDASKQKDGMDIALLKFNTITNKVEYSAANRPLYLVRNNELIEYKADKVAIAGFTEDNQVFKTTNIQLEKNDSLYLFTDGFADQFGGEEGKKFMSKNLKLLFISICNLNSNDQYKAIDNTFLSWKNTNEQVDDVLIIGIKI